MTRRERTRMLFLVLDPFPGQEEWNADFVSAIGAGASLRTPIMAGRTAATLAQDDAALARMGSQAASHARPDAAAVVADIVIAWRGED